NGKAMFDKVGFFKRLRMMFRYAYTDSKLRDKLKEVYGEDTLLGSEKLRSLLLMVLRNASTDSPWPLSNNPFAKYNQRERADCNLNLPLWQLVRASAAAPVYFPPEEARIGKQTFVFVDGGITPYNNPAFQAFLMA
ncbi:MAG: patatin-like phospholipase family protein, partial [Calditrichaeota bacterium]|nr:patatin-like phospholipase family protein [Calditrichota bacterium]